LNPQNKKQSVSLAKSMEKHLFKQLFKAGLPFQLSTLFIFLLSFSLNAQELFSFQLDIGGASPYASLNIERMIFKKTNVEVKIKAGVGVVGIDVKEPPRVYMKPKPSFPLGLNLLLGKEKRPYNFEIGVQGTLVSRMTIPELWDPVYIYTEDVKNKILPSYFVGLRFRPFNRKGVVRAGYNPIFLDGKRIDWGVLSLGWNFSSPKKDKKN
jgi:hypothetical protein